MSELPTELLSIKPRKCETIIKLYTKEELNEARRDTNEKWKEKLITLTNIDLSYYFIRKDDVKELLEEKK